jgi:hypothetical protein
MILLLQLFLVKIMAVEVIEIFRMGMSSNVFFCVGECGNVNNSTAAWTAQPQTFVALCGALKIERE